MPASTASEFSTRCHALRWQLLPCLLLSAVLAGCATTPRAVPAMSVTPVPAPEVLPPLDDIGPLLNYHQALRRLTQGELLKELSGLLQQKRTPRVTLQTGMVLMLTRGNGDLARAQGLLDNVANSTEASAAPYKGLAQLLASFCAESRRLTEHVERLNTQLATQQKESQRRIDQLNDMVEGLKNIERTLPARPAAGAGPGAGK
ncbi:hypothetical protein ASF61_09150 [Duganella sp. Leaf126]|uniref:hypothetical protein n=1 Tax=Duganella sp. Leaf126 TaxID=1736266 RepID=UPI0006FF4551|nr:hypothetical protein [Duganella sp. Leaf126]KQQ33257.1 hypothetical protein ASF61_09150 [Duganella sp. Leaf126]